MKGLHLGIDLNIRLFDDFDSNFLSTFEVSLNRNPVAIFCRLLMFLWLLAFSVLSHFALNFFRLFLSDQEFDLEFCQLISMTTYWMTINFNVHISKLSEVKEKNTRFQLYWNWWEFKLRLHSITIGLHYCVFCFTTLYIQCLQNVHEFLHCFYLLFHFFSMLMIMMRNSVNDIQ